MLRLVLRRLVTAIPLVWLVATLTFVLVHAMPGSYADLLASDQPRLTPEALEQIRHRYGLDQPLLTQYLCWLGALARADLGVSFLYQRPVATVIGEAIGPTLLLTVPALSLDLLLGLILAVSAVRRPHGWYDRLTSLLSLGVYGLPAFWLAGIAVLVFALFLGWFPASHMSSVGADQLGPMARLLDLVWHMVLPVACLGLIGAAATARYLRASLLDLRGARFLLAARARGLSERRVLWVHTLRPALLPVVTVLGLSLPYLISGSLVIEVIFSWPGMGQVMWKAAMARDIPVIMAATVTGAVAVVIGNLIADLLYAVVDPRARDAQ
jgi:peptide/nickel transport system permease protein